MYTNLQSFLPGWRKGNQGEEKEEKKQIPIKSMMISKRERAPLPALGSLGPGTWN